MTDELESVDGPADETDGFPTLQEIAELDRQFIEKNLSPGGCADLLAVTLFLDSLSRL
jgi:triphosphoribosyl-dephospho-CoA synthetase